MAELMVAKGVRDIDPQIKLIKNEVISKLQEMFELYGFAPLETPAVERFENLGAKFAAGEESDALKEIFHVTDNARRHLALRFDLTVPLARYVAMNKDIKMPFKRYEVGRVYRDGPIKLGRYREFWQCDIDIVGSKSMLCEAELLAVAQGFFASIGVDVLLKVNNRKVLTGILNQVGVSSDDIEGAIISIDKLDKIGVSGVSEELAAKGYTAEQIAALFSVIKKGITLEELKSKVNDSVALEGMNDLEELFTYLENMGIDKVVFDVSLARGLAYYTGTVFEAFATSGPVTSSLCGGGRYDDMIGSFIGGNASVPAVGVSFGIEPVIDILKSQREVLQKSPAQLFMVPIGDCTVKVLAIAEEFRDAGVKVSFSIGKKGVSKSLAYASSLNIPYVVIIGQKEIEENKITLRDMRSGEESKISVEDALLKLEKELHE